MAKCPEKVKLTFDMNELWLLKNKTARILWCCIKTGHLTSQYFNDNVLAVAEAIDKIHETKTLSYPKFKNVIERSTLQKFGRRTIKEVGFFCHQDEFDDEYWTGIYGYIMGEKELQIETPTESVKNG